MQSITPIVPSSDPPAEAGAAGKPNPDHQTLWFALARQRVRSVALLAVDPGLPVAHLAEILAEIGKRLGDHPVTAITAEQCDYDFVARTASVIASTTRDAGRRPGASPLEIIVAIPSVKGQPLGLAVAQAVDAVVLCIGLGQTTIDTTREVADLVGRERILGCVVLGAP